MRLSTPAILIFAAGLLSGCARGNVELLEARLRNREDQLRQLDTQLTQAQQELARSERERDLLQQQLVDTHREKLQFEVSRTLARIEGLRINPRLTGILKNSQSPESLSLNLLFSPVDADSEPVKLEGRTVIELLDFSTPSPQHRVHVWEFTPEETAESWHAGFIGEGFQFSLPVPPGSESLALMINVSFETLDGRRFHATHELAADVDSERPVRNTNEPPPLPQSASLDRSKAADITQVDFSQERDALPPATAKIIPLDQLLSPE